MKNILLSCFFILFSFGVSAQGWKDLNSQVLELYKNKEFEKALPIAEQTIKAVKKELGEINESYVTVLENLASIYIQLAQLEKAEPIYIQAAEIRKKVSGESHPDYGKSLNNLAGLYKKMGLYEKAEPFYLEAMVISKKVFGESHADFAISLNNLAALYEDMGQYKKAEPLYSEAMVISKKVFGESHPNYATSLNNLALLYTKMSQYEKAEPLYVEAMTIRKNVLGKSHADYANSLNNLASLYQDMGGYEKAEPLYIESKEIRKKLFGKNHPYYAAILNNLASLYKDMGQFEKALPLYIESKEIQKILFGENHPKYAISLNNLASIYSLMGQYDKAESLLIQAKEIRKKKLGENHPDYAMSLNNLAVFYKIMGQFDKAEKLYIESKEIQKNNSGKSHPEYVISLNNLACLYGDMGQYERAEPLFIEAKEIRKKILGENHPDYATSLNNLATLYQDMGQFKKAEQLHIEAIEIQYRILGKKHPDYAMSLNNLAALYKISGLYKKSEALYIEAKETRKNILGENHPDYARSLNNLATLYEAMGLYKKAEPLFLSSADIIIKNLKKTFSILSEKEKENYLVNNISLMDINNSLLYKYKKGSSSLLIGNYNLIIFFKSLSLADTRMMLESVNKIKDSTIQNVYKAWQSNKSLLAKQYSLPFDKRIQKLESIEVKAEALEKELALKSSEFRIQQKKINISITDVQNNLQQDEVAIEFVRFRLYTKKWTDSIIYAAYILRKNDSVPVFVPICEEKQLGKYFSSTAGSSNIKTIYRSDPMDEDDKPSISGDSLYALVWKPLLPYLKGINKIDYSPAGLLYKIAFHALPAGDSSLLMDKYELNQYTSIRQLAIQDEKKENNNSIALFGNCLFSMDSNTVVKNIPADEKANILITAIVNRGDNAGGWNQLEGTANEITSIKSLFDQHKFTTGLYEQESATEEQFKSLSGNPPTILHLATHGFFLPDPVKKKQEGFEADNRNAFTLADDPLLRSGIVLSGANRVWSGQPPIEGREDGIVTAYEIAQMDLHKTDLVVLSACETALGDIKGNEGVFGLQRAFKLAGVKNMLLSLWKVPDAETAELMKVFYTYYLQGKTARESFAAAQKDMRKKYKAFYWAAFVLIE